ncbi:unnamed protein product [Auanema sp. JU1783]|nr:unnamed protein product [Auanema sp. JU1783]
MHIHSNLLFVILLINTILNLVSISTFPVFERSITLSTMTSSEGKSSPFLSLFHRKKRINGTKTSDDIKSVLTPTKTVQTKTNNSQKSKAKKLPDSKTLPASIHRKKKGREKSFWGTKSQSLDDLIPFDPCALLEALETIAADKPMVARSIPKHAKIMKKEDKSMNNCLFEKEVYDSMLCDSLRVCDLLQSHLDDCIVSVRTKSPEPGLDLSQDCRDSGKGNSSASSTISLSPSTKKRPMKSCVRADV